MEKLANMLRYGVILAICYYVFPYFLPFIFATIFVVLWEPMVRFLESKLKWKRWISVTILYTATYIGSLAGIYFVIIRLWKESIDLAKKIPVFIKNFYQTDSEVFKLYQKLPDDLQEHVDSTLLGISTSISNKASDYVGEIINYVYAFGEFIVVFIIFIVATYLLGMMGPSLKATFLSFFAHGTTKKGVDILLSKLKSAIVGFLRAQVIISLIIFIVTWAGAKIIGLPYAAVSALIVVLIDLLPILGTSAAILPWAGYLFFNGNPNEAIGLLVLLGILTVIRRAVEPKLLADTLGISALATLISMYVGLSMMGLTGMILGPAVVIVVKALEEAGLIELKIRIKN